jgi:hypothetical protein
MFRPVDYHCQSSFRPNCNDTHRSQVETRVQISVRMPAMVTKDFQFSSIHPGKYSAAPQIRSQLLPSRSIPIHYSLSALLFYVIYVYIYIYNLTY